MSEIAVRRLTFALPAGVKTSQSMGSLLHGLIMEQIDPAYATYLHESRLKPFSQYVSYVKETGELVWTVTALEQEAIENILAPLSELKGEILLRQKGYALTLRTNEIVAETSYAQLAEECFGKDCPYSKIEFTFLTSCSFKRNGQYVIFPETELILGSLIRRWNACATEHLLDGNNLAQDLARHTYVASYANLRLNRFGLEGATIPAFRGEYVIGLKHNMMLNRLISMLSLYAPYAGVGIKTALGMGAVKTAHPRNPR